VLALGSQQRPREPTPRPRLAAVRDASSPPPLPHLERVERDLLADALERYGTLRAAAVAVGIPKSTFADRAHKLGLLVSGRARR
jgi:DNA-binding NtrC family response regulator